MNRLIVGIVTESSNLPTNGGSFSYSQTWLNGINNFTFDERIVIINVFIDADNLTVSFKKQPITNNQSIAPQVKISATKKVYVFSKVFLKSIPVISFLHKKIKLIKKNKIEKLLIKNKIDVLYYLHHTNAVLNYPFIATHWDVAHRSTYPFPEIAMNNHNKTRENYYVNTLNKALLILCESNAGCDELKTFYPSFSSKIKTLPLFASDIINLKKSTNTDFVLDKYHVTVYKYFLYPAQFWAHKNHYNLIIAFKQFLDKNIQNKIKLILCGSDKGNMNYIKDLVLALHLTENVLITGFVPDQDLAVLYKNAIALVMPTFLGPTNMPLIEAAHIGCPVICSDFAGHREIMGEHAIFINPKNANEIELAMAKMLSYNFRNNLVKNAYEHIKNSPFNLQKSLKILNSFLIDILPVRKTWGLNSDLF